MVILEKLEVINFRKLNLILDFPNGVLVIKGPNESGKSTILESVLFALYGRLQRGTNEFAINHRSTQATLKLTFSIDGVKYTVLRIIKRRGSSEAYLYRENKKIATGVKSVTSKIVKILGDISFNEMLVTNVVAQKELDRIMSLSKNEREKILNLLLGLDSYNKALDKVNEDLREKRKDSETVKETLKQVEKRLEQYHRDIEELKKRSNELEKSNSKLTEIKSKISKIEPLYTILKEYKEILNKRKIIEERIKGIKNNISTLESSIESVKEEIKKLKNKLKEDVNTLQTLEKEKNRNSSLLSKYDELPIIEKKLRDIEKLFNKITINNSKINQYDKEIEKIEGEIGELEKYISAYDALIKREEEIKREYDSIRVSPKISIALLSTSILGIFFTPLLILGPLLTVIYILIVNHKRNYLRKELLEISEKLKSIMDMRSHIEYDRKKIQTLQNEKQKTLTETIQINNKIINIFNEIKEEYRPKEYKDLEDLYTKTLDKFKEKQKERENINMTIEKLKTRISGIKENIEQNKKYIADNENKLKDLEKKLSKEKEKLQEEYKEIEKLKLPELPKDIEYSDKLYNKIEKEYNELISFRTEYETKIKDLKKIINELKDRIEENKDVENTYNELKKKSENLDFLISALQETKTALKEVSAIIREDFRPSIEQNMSNIINDITGGRYKAVQLTDKYDIKIYDIYASKFITKDIFSGGTQDQFLLAMRLAFILSLLPQTKQTYPRFLFLDEPLASSDTERRQNIINLLTNKLTEYFNQIILITHLDIKPEKSKIITLEEGKIIKI